MAERDDRRVAAGALDQSVPGERAEQAGPAAGASYTLIGAIIAARRLGYASTAGAARRPGFCSAGCCWARRRLLRAGQDRLAHDEAGRRGWSAEPASPRWLIAARCRPRPMRPRCCSGCSRPLRRGVRDVGAGRADLPARSASADRRVMIAAFAVKMVFFGAYVAVMLRGSALRPMPFVVSFTGYFIALALVEALCCGACSRVATYASMLVQRRFRNTCAAARRGRARSRREVRRRQDDHRARLEQRDRPSADPSADDARHRLLGDQARPDAVAGRGLRVRRRDLDGPALPEAGPAGSVRLR